MQIRQPVVFGWVGTFVPGRGRYVGDSDVSILFAELFVSAIYRGTRGQYLIVMMKMARARRDA